MILLGGKNSRMGMPKWRLSLGKQSILEHIISRLGNSSPSIVLNGNQEELKAYTYPIIPDTIGDFQGPLAGLLSGLEYAKKVGKSWVITCPCDTPFLPLDFVTRLINNIGPKAECAIASSYGKNHPVCGLWSIDLIAPLKHTLLNSHRRSIGWWATQLTPTPSIIDFSDVGDTDPFMNINTQADWARAIELYDQIANKN